MTFELYLVRANAIVCLVTLACTALFSLAKSRGAVTPSTCLGMVGLFVVCVVIGAALPRGPLVAWLFLAPFLIAAAPARAFLLVRRPGAAAIVVSIAFVCALLGAGGAVGSLM